MGVESCSIDVSIFFKMINGLNIQSALDAGMTLINNRNFSRQNVEDEISQDILLDCLDYSNGENIVPVYKAVYNNIYTINDDITTHYGLINLLGQIEKIREEDRINFLVGCLELADVILYNIPKESYSEKEHLGVFYERSRILEINDYEYEYRILNSIDIIQEILLLYIEEEKFHIAETLADKYIKIYPDSQELLMMEEYIQKRMNNKDEQ